MKNILLLVVILFSVSCSGTKSRTKEVSKPQSYTFKRVLPPAQATPESQFNYMVEHYWDRFDFADTLFIERVDTMEMMRAYVDYIANYVGPYNGEPIAKLMKKASVSRKMLDYFVSMSEKILHDPNSPMRSDELYIPVLEAQLSSPYYDEYERLVPQFDLQLASQNRLFRQANDFRYTTSSGKSYNLYSLVADYVLIYINNPGCPMCGQIQAQIESSEIINSMIAQGRLKVLAIYPEADITLWRKHPLPKSWISGYDKGCTIEKHNLYDLRAIPSLYLLDRDKKVLIKDSTSVPDIEQVIQSKPY